MMSPGHIKLEASLDKEVSHNSAIPSLAYLNKMGQVVRCFQVMKEMADINLPKNGGLNDTSDVFHLLSQR